MDDESPSYVPSCFCFAFCACLAFLYVLSSLFFGDLFLLPELVDGDGGTGLLLGAGGRGGGDGSFRFG